MTALLERLRASIQTFGQQVLLDGEERRAMIRVLTANQVKVWLDSLLVDAAPRPLRGFVFEGGTAVEVDQVIEWDGVNWRVRFVRPYSVGGTSLALLAIAWPDS